MSNLRERLNETWKYLVGGVVTLLITGAGGWVALGSYKNQVDTNTKIIQKDLPALQEDIRDLKIADEQLRGDEKVDKAQIELLKQYLQELREGNKEILKRLPKRTN